jgi:hypothetical protein
MPSGSDPDVERICGGGGGGGGGGIGDEAAARTAKRPSLNWAAGVVAVAYSSSTSSQQVTGAVLQTTHSSVTLNFEGLKSSASDDYSVLLHLRSAIDAAWRDFGVAKSQSRSRGCDMF